MGCRESNKPKYKLELQECDPAKFEEEGSKNIHRPWSNCRTDRTQESYLASIIVIIIYHGTCVLYQSKSGAEQANEIEQAFAFTSIHWSAAETMNRGASNTARTYRVLRGNTRIHPPSIQRNIHTQKQTSTDCSKGEKTTWVLS